MDVAADNEVSAAGDGAFEDPVVGRILRHDREARWSKDDFGHLGDRQEEAVIGRVLREV